MTLTGAHTGRSRALCRACACSCSVSVRAASNAGITRLRRARAHSYRPSAGRPEWRTRGNLHLDLHPWHYLHGGTGAALGPQIVRAGTGGACGLLKVVILARNDARSSATNSRRVAPGFSLSRIHERSGYNLHGGFRGGRVVARA